MSGLRGARVAPVLGVLLALLVATLAPTSLPHAAGTVLPSGTFGGPAATTTGTIAPAIDAASAASRDAPAASSPAPAATCPTPQNSPNWNSTSFFNDALVSFQVPGDPAISGSNFYAVPCLNTIPTYEDGFYLNVTTDVPISEAFLWVWGTTWPTATDPLPPLNGFAPSNPMKMPMLVTSTSPDSASFYFNVYRFFYPGSTVEFNITLESTYATPTTISSTSSPFQAELPAGSGDLATWSFYVQSPWWSTTFTNDIRISTSPPVLSTPVYEPNPVQPFAVGIESVGPTGAVGVPIPQAELLFTLKGNYAGDFSDQFGPTNASFQNITNVIGPYIGSELNFSVKAWLPWEGGQIDVITSQNYSFNWSTKGGWWAPSQGLEANANLSTDPYISNTSSTVLGTGTSVNVSVTEGIPNVTISSAVVRFTYQDANGVTSGSYAMTALTQNSTYAVLPGLPNGGRLTYTVLAKDVDGNPVSSGSYSYLEKGATTVPEESLQNWMYIEAVNITTDVLLPGAAYTIANATWSASGVTGPFGFGAPVAASGQGFRLLGDGLYTVTVSDFGHTLSSQVNLTGATPITVPFVFSRGGVSESASVPTVALVAGLIAGPIVAAVALYPLYLWYRERQQKAAEEQKRITL